MRGQAFDHYFRRYLEFRGFTGTARIDCKARQMMVRAFPEHRSTLVLKKDFLFFV